MEDQNARSDSPPPFNWNGVGAGRSAEIWTVRIYEGNLQMSIRRMLIFRVGIILHAPPSRPENLTNMVIIRTFVPFASHRPPNDNWIGTSQPFPWRFL